MTKAQIIELQRQVGTTPDGFWGPKSTSAAQRHLRALMPKVSPWPASDSQSLRRFYGEPGDESVIVSVPAPPFLRLYDTAKKVTRIRCHHRVADSLLRALFDGHEKAPEVVARYFGCFVNRNMRGGSKPSLHAYGAAIDLDASSNGNRTHWPIRATMPIEVMEAFAREGWLAAGAFWSRDAMHFQATR